MSQRGSAAVERQGIRPVPMEERTHGWWDLTLVFVGIFTHLVAFAAGADFVRNLGFWRTVLCVTLGGALVIPFYLTGGWIAARHGIPGSVAMRIAFGIRGSWIPSILNAVVAMGWFALQTSISALAFDKIIISFGGSSHFHLWVLVWGLIYCLNAIIGYGFITSFARYAVPVLYGMFAYVLFKIAATYDVTRAFAFVPAAGGLSFFFLTDAVFGGWGGTSLTLIADYSRYARNRAVTLSGGVAAVVVSTFVVSVGAMATIASGNRDITMTLLQLGLGFSAMIVVIFATWTTNPCNTYSAGLSLSNITGWGRVTGVAAMGTVGISLALLGILEHMVYFLEVVGLTLAPANSILLVEYFFFARQRVDTQTLLDGGGPYDYWRGINPAAVAAWGLALAVILLLNFVARAPWLALPALSTCVLTGILYAIFRWALMRRAPRQAPAQ